MTAIKSLLSTDRPREKLEKYGIAMLTTTELLMLILGSGSKNFTVDQLASRLEKQYQTNRELSLSQLLEIKGIGLAKACQILASLELSQRLHPKTPYEVLNSPAKILPYLSELKTSPREQVIGLYLNARLKLVHKEVLSIGALNQTILTPKEIFQVIKHTPALHLILAHNHPSQDTTPSPEDIAFTNRVKQAAQIMGMSLLDHLIITAESHYSFQEQGLL